MYLVIAVVKGGGKVVVACVSKVDAVLGFGQVGEDGELLICCRVCDTA